MLQMGDIVRNNNSWLGGLLGMSNAPGVIIHSGSYSSIVHLFITRQDFTIMNDYIDKIKLTDYNGTLKVGDLVQLKPELLKILSIVGVGVIIEDTIIKTSGFDGKWLNEHIEAFIVFFSDANCEYTIPKSCLTVFFPASND